MEQLTLVLDNVRSAHNVGSIARSAAAFGVSQIYCVGITPYPEIMNDTRLPHVIRRVTAQIRKTALGAQTYCEFRHFDHIESAIADLRSQKARIVALELDDRAENMVSYKPQLPTGLILGNEISGINRSALDSADTILRINHSDAKESLNVAAASSITLFYFYNKITEQG